MSGTLNKVMLIGHLGDDVKMHYFDGGGSLGRFPLATNESYVNKSTGEKVSNTEWHNIVVRNKAAEICEKYLSKGDKIYIEGRIKTRKWTGEDGNDRYSTEINVLIDIKPVHYFHIVDELILIIYVNFQWHRYSFFQRITEILPEPII